MAKKKIVEFDGSISAEMMSVWGIASLGGFEFRKYLSVLMFRFKPTPDMGMRVVGAPSIIISQELAEEAIVASGFFNQAV